jgi:hypothetical protein
MVNVIVFIATFNNITAISRQSVLLVEGTGSSGEKNNDLQQVTDKLYHLIFHRVHLALSRI